MSSYAWLPPNTADRMVPAAISAVKIMIRMLDLPVLFTSRPITVTPTRDATKQMGAKTTA